ncbi:hypothetical protein [Nitriliruptor alkaliphilus]|uniref:hypothetical protein n=1 Tax=Nitriliruptor alkaliphilus TaxID=427918 RepID=UPI000698C245|nr:hypothetical protein [Nitriliruptor alkaliphilus]
MRRYLVVANQTLGGEQLMERLRSCVAEGPCAVHVVVPASADPTVAFHDEFSDRKLAKSRLGEALKRFEALGVEVTGEVGDHRPVDAVLDVLRRGVEVDEVIVSTLPAGVSRWLRLDAVSRIERAVEVPVTHIETVDTSVGATGS